MRGHKAELYEHGHPELACKRYHPIIPANIRIGSDGVRRCKPCHVAADNDRQIRRAWKCLGPRTELRLMANYAAFMAMYPTIKKEGLVTCLD